MVLIGRQGRRRVVLAADAAAQALRIFPGVPAAQASAHSTDLVTMDADPEGDAANLERLALWALRLYAPIVAADPPDGLVLDVTGAAHRWGGEETLLADMTNRLKAVGVEARAAVSESWGSAHALARYLASPTLVLQSDLIGRAMADLPVRALRVPDETTLGLGKMGIDTVGELQAKPRSPLALRFGAELLRRLDQAIGDQDEPIEPVEAPELIQVRKAFFEPIGAPETLTRYIEKLAIALCDALETRGLGALKLDLRFVRVDRKVEVIRVGAARPIRDVKRMRKLLCDKLETIAPGEGVEAMVLAAPHAERLDWKPIAADLVDQPEPDVEDLIDVLMNRYGSDRLFRSAPAESDVPERSVRKLSPSADPSGQDWPARWARPTRLLPRPEPIEAVALLPDQPPVAFTWRGVRRRVRAADGPERIFGEWWRRDGEMDAVRDYFQLEDEAGGRFWVFRRGDGEFAMTGDLTWWLHGVFA